MSLILAFSFTASISAARMDFVEVLFAVDCELAVEASEPCRERSGAEWTTSLIGEAGGGEGGVTGVDAGFVDLSSCVSDGDLDLVEQSSASLATTS